MDNSISDDDNKITTVAAAAVVAASTATAAVGAPTITKSSDGSHLSCDDDQHHTIAGYDDNAKNKTFTTTEEETAATATATVASTGESKDFSLRRNDGSYKRITSKCISRARDFVHKCQSDPGGSRPSTSAIQLATNRSSQRSSLRNQSPGYSAHKINASTMSTTATTSTTTTTRKCVLTLDGYNYVIGKLQKQNKKKSRITFYQHFI